MKLKNTNSQLQRDKIRDADLIESYKKVLQSFSHPISCELPDRSLIFKY